jgi:hypothetical protein
MGRNLLNRIAKLEELMPWPLKPNTVWALHFSPQDPQPTPAQIDWMIEKYLANRRFPPHVVNMDCRGWFEVYQGPDEDEDDDEYEDEEEEEKEEVWFVNDDYDPASADDSSAPETSPEPPPEANAAPEPHPVSSIPPEPPSIPCVPPSPPAPPVVQSLPVPAYLNQAWMPSECHPVSRIPPEHLVPGTPR